MKDPLRNLPLTNNPKRRSRLLKKRKKKVPKMSSQIRMLHQKISQKRPSSFERTHSSENQK